MGKRKSSNPSKLNNTNLDWSWSSQDSNNIDDSTCAKRIKTNLIPTIIYKYNKENEDYFFKSINFGKTNNIIPIEWNKCKVLFKEVNITLVFNDDTYVIVHPSDIINLKYLKDLFSTKIFKYNLVIKENSEDIELSFYLSYIENIKWNKKIGAAVDWLMSIFFNISTTDVYENTLTVHENMEELYKSVKIYRENKQSSSELINSNIQHPFLLPTLRPYQEEAVKWMIHKEQNIILKESLNPLYEKITLQSGINIFYDKYSKFITITEPIIKYYQAGGILADEMGLGKTVEMLACILNHPRNLLDDSNNQEEINLNDTKNLNNCHDNVNNENTTLELDTINNCQIDTEIINKEEKIDENIPTIDTQKKYKKPKEKVKKNIKDLNQKNLYSNLSPAKRAAQLWYQSKLSEVFIKKRVIREPVKEVECICGDLGKKGIIKCKDCDKMQHKLCMGYKHVDDSNYTCPQCWLNKPLIKSKATLIVSPQTISRQWSSEVQRHIRKNGLKILEYNGIHNAGMIYPPDLANYDLVITTYSVLQSEIKFTNEEPSTKSLRFAKRYNIPSTPLLCIEWWRLCLDEAQNVECPTNLVSCMASQLNAIHRWAVTGTPVQKNITDIYGLIDYLQLSPYNDIHVWNHKLYYPYINGNKQNMIEFLSDILWRSAKNDVINQINLPTQTFEEHWLEFSAVEKFFYSREHESCAQNFLNKLKDYKNLDTALKKIDRHTLNLILAPLLSLRQACTHPHAVRGKYLASRKQVNSMEELLDALIKKNTHDSTEALRAVIAALNGEAGILLLQNRILEAVDKYRLVLNYVSEYDGKCDIQIDKLQCIHTLYNLNEILNKNKTLGIPPTLRDDKLKEDYETYQCKYMEKFISETRLALEEVNLIRNKVKKEEKNLAMKEGEWLSDLVDFIIEMNLERELISKIDCFQTDTEQRKNIIINGVRELTYIITTWIDKTTKHATKIYNLMNEIEDAFRNNKNFYICEEIIQSATDCHLRPNKQLKNKPKTCLCCNVDTMLKKYETCIFQMINKNKVSNTGTWHPSIEENMLKIAYNFGKSRGINSELIIDGEKHLKLLSLRRIEFKELRKLYTYFDQQVSAQDELDICKIRFRLRNSEEPTKIIQKKKANALQNLNYELENKYEFINLLNEHELDFNYNLLDIEKIANDEKLKRLIGTHSYLETLKKQQYDGQEPDPCPICKTQLTGTWSILQCGHCYCLDCITTILERNSIGNSVTCSICRKKQLYTDVSYIKTKETVENTIDDIEIKGSYSTKIHAIIGCVLKLRQNDPDIKIIIFSTWQAVLKVLNKALNVNNISNEFVLSTNFQMKLQKFKEKKHNVTALLMPVRLGANGLNLIEATHIILVEPLMNPGEEAQAIGRIHRIGQTKPTVIHRFLIKSTIEENIYEATSTNAQKWDSNKLTLSELKGLFVKDDNLNKNHEKVPDVIEINNEEQNLIPENILQ